MASRSLLVEIVGDSSSLQKALGSASTSGEAFGSTMKKVAIAAAAGLGAIGLAVDKSVKAALAAQTSQARLASVFKAAGLSAAASAAQIDKAQKSGENLGFTSEQTSQSLGGLITATGSVKTAMSDLSVAQDLARFKGQDLTSTTQMLAQAMAGSQRATHALGITIIPTTTNVQALKNAHVLLTNAAGQAALAHAKLMDKMATGQAVIAAVTAKVKGQAQAFAQTAAGSMEVFRAKLTQLEVTIGDALLPALTRVVGGLSSLVSWLQSSASAQGIAAGAVTVLKDAFAALVSVGQSVVAFYEQNKTLVLAVGAAVGAATVAITAISFATKAWAAATEILNAVLALNPIVLIATAIIALGAALVVVYNRSQTFRNIVNGAFNDVKAVVLPIVTALENAWQHWGGLVENVATVAWDFVKTEFKVALALIEGIVNTFTDVFTGNWSGAWDDIKSTVSTVFGDILSFLGSVGSQLGPIAVWMGETIANGIISGMNALTGAIVGIMDAAVNVVIAGINAMVSKINTIKWGAVKVAGQTVVPGFGGLGIGTVGNVSLGGALSVSKPFSPGAAPSFALPSIGGAVSTAGPGGAHGGSFGTGARSGGAGGGGSGSGGGGALSPKLSTKKGPAYKIPEKLAAAIKKAQQTFKDSVTQQHLDTLDSLYKQEESLLKAHGEDPQAQTVANEITTAGKKLQAAVAKTQLDAAKKNITMIQKAAAGPAAVVKAAQAAGAPDAVILQDEQTSLAVYQVAAADLKSKLAASTGKAKAAYQTALTKIQSSISSTHDAIIASLQNLAQTAQTALQTVLSKVESAADLQLGTQYFQGALQTPAEAALAAMQAQDQAQQLQDALAQAQQSGDQASIDSAQRAIDENNLSIQATAQRAAADAAYAQAQFNLNSQIDNLSKNAGDGSTTMAALAKIAAQFGINLGTLADPGGNGLFAQLTSAITDTVSAFNALTRAAGGKVTSTASASAAAATPVWSPPSTGAQIRGGIGYGGALAAGGIVSRAMLAMVGDAGPEAVIPLSKLSSLSGGQNINVYVNGWVGNDQQIAARIQKELIKTGRRNPTIFTGTGVTV